MLLGLDLSTRATGFAFGDEKCGKPTSGAWKMPGAADDVLDRTLGGIFESISTLCKVAKVTRVVIEAPIMIANRSSHTAMALIQLTGAARAAAHLAGASVRLVPVQTVRKHFIGKGRPDNPKLATMERCRLLGWPVDSDDAADAVAAWAWGVSTYYPRWSPNSTPLFAKRERP